MYEMRKSVCKQVPCRQRFECGENGFAVCEMCPYGALGEAYLTGLKLNHAPTSIPTTRSDVTSMTLLTRT